jgi:hypothetical protein
MALSLKKGERRDLRAFTSRFRDPTFNATVLLLLPAKARQRKKSSFGYQTVAIFMNRAPVRGRSPPNPRTFRAPGNRVAPSHPFVHYPARNINEFRASADETFLAKVVFSLKQWKCK